MPLFLSFTLENTFKLKFFLAKFLDLDFILGKFQLTASGSLKKSVIPSFSFG